MSTNTFRGDADEESGAINSARSVPTGGESVGGATDRKQPDRTIRFTATGANTDVTGTGTDRLKAVEDEE